MQNKITILHGNILDRIKEIPDNSIHCVVTSPPYYGLRSYSTEPQIWGGDDKCEHEWIESTCSKCGAWLGHLGLEPNINMFINHLVEIFEEVKRILHPSGVIYFNIADSYSDSGGLTSKYDRYGKTLENFDNPNRKIINLPPKNLYLVPFRLAIALQESGWIVRSTIIWTKPNPMPESVKDRVTNDFEYVFMMTKSPKYFWDKESVRIKLKESTISRYRYGLKSNEYRDYTGGKQNNLSKYMNPEKSKQLSGANLRSTWTIPTEPLYCAVCFVCGKYWHRNSPLTHCGKPIVGHFASFPQKLVELCIKSGSSEYGCCPICLSPWKRIIKPSEEYAKYLGSDLINKKAHDKSERYEKGLSQKKEKPSLSASYETIGWQPTCSCESNEVIPCTIFDPFGGSGTTGIVATKLNRNAILIELNRNYVNMAKGRILKECGILAKIEVK